VNAVLTDFAAGALRSPALRTAAALAAGGFGFAAGNVLLARILAETEFGRVSLLLSLIQVGSALGAPGIPLLINRYRLSATPDLLRRCSFGAALAGLVVAAGAMLFGHFSTALAVTLGITTAMAALGRIGAAFFQAREYFLSATLLGQIHNWLLLASVPVVLLLDEPYALTVGVFLLLGYIATAIVGWRRAPGRSAEVASLPPTVWSKEVVSAAGIALALNVLFQFDRLLVGALLSLEELATYSVVAAIAGSTFRMLQVGASHSLTPRLRRCRGRAEALELLRTEGTLLAGVGVLAAAAILLVMPWIVDHFLAGRYEVPPGLVAVMIGIGLVRTWEAMATATVNALGTPRDLWLLNVMSWSAVAVGILGAIVGTSAGLVGVVLGLGAAWVALAAGSSLLALRAIKGQAKEQR
jgi:O-antigen/teichoic acid export membrane protein